MAIKEPVGESLIPPHREGQDLSLDKVTFGVAAAIAIAFLLWGTLDSEGMGTTTGELLGWLETTFGWLFILVSASFLLFSDRKSTRLNSSHVEISYAVFCLKKK